MQQDHSIIITAYNDAYNQHSGMESKLGIASYDKECAWLEFARHFSVDDLIGVCKRLRREVARGNRQQACLRFSRLIGDLATFEEELSLAREDKLRQKPARTDRDSVLDQTGRAPANVVKIPGPPKEVVDRLLQNFRDSVK